jgi:hypothetical protein
MTRPSRRAIVRTVVWTKPDAGTVGESEGRHVALPASAADGTGHLKVTAAALARMVRRDS